MPEAFVLETLRTARTTGPRGLTGQLVSLTLVRRPVSTGRERSLTPQAAARGAAGLGVAVLVERVAS